jgi:hypothetical protein
LCPKKLICHVGGEGEKQKRVPAPEEEEGILKGRLHKIVVGTLLVVILIAMCSLLRLKLFSGISENWKTLPYTWKQPIKKYI